MSYTVVIQEALTQQLYIKKSQAQCWIYFPQLTAEATAFPRRLFFYRVFCSFDWNLISFLFDKNDKLRERGNKSLGSANPDSYQTSEENKHFLHGIPHFVF